MRQRGGAMVHPAAAPDRLRAVGNSLDELHQAVRWVGEGKFRTVVDRTLLLERFQEGLDALAAGELVGPAVLTPAG